MHKCTGNAKSAQESEETHAMHKCKSLTSSTTDIRSIIQRN